MDVTWGMEYILEYPLGIGRRESVTTRTGGVGEGGSAREATKTGWASTRGYTTALEALFADLVINGALVLVTEHLECFGNLGGG